MPTTSAFAHTNLNTILGSIATNMSDIATKLNTVKNNLSDIKDDLATFKTRGTTVTQGVCTKKVLTNNSFQRALTITPIKGNDPLWLEIRQEIANPTVLP